MWLKQQTCGLSNIVKLKGIRNIWITLEYHGNDVINQEYRGILLIKMVDRVSFFRKCIADNVRLVASICVIFQLSHIFGMGLNLIESAKCNDHMKSMRHKADLNWFEGTKYRNLPSWL